MHLLFYFFFFNDTATTEIYTLSLHDALPISAKQPESPALSKDSASHEHDREWQAKYGNPQIAAHEANGGFTFPPGGEKLSRKGFYAGGSFFERTLESDKMSPEDFEKIQKENAEV